ncbi:hypothetical protein [Streptomyces sp. NPDC047981]|uniref:hypothetical protein n=1 Tax=Streptomyces sp. NPDC047981 TaxID=3154610 RepID=UPI00343C432A
MLRALQKSGGKTLKSVAIDFFELDTAAALACLDRLTAAGQLTRMTDRRGWTSWLPVTPSAVTRERRSAARAAKQRERRMGLDVTHAFCDHALTKTDSALCLASIGKDELVARSRKGRGLPPLPEAESEPVALPDPIEMHQTAVSKPEAVRQPGYLDSQWAAYVDGLEHELTGVQTRARHGVSVEVMRTQLLVFVTMYGLAHSIIRKPGMLCFRIFP